MTKPICNKNDGDIYLSITSYKISTIELGIITEYLFNLVYIFDN